MPFTGEHLKLCGALGIEKPGDVPRFQLRMEHETNTLHARHSWLFVFPIIFRVSTCFNHPFGGAGFRNHPQYVTHVIFLWPTHSIWLIRPSQLAMSLTGSPVWACQQASGRFLSPVPRICGLYMVRSHCIYIYIICNYSCIGVISLYPNLWRLKSHSPIKLSPDHPPSVIFYSQGNPLLRARAKDNYLTSWESLNVAELSMLHAEKNCRQTNEFYRFYRFKGSHTQASNEDS